MSSSSGKQIFSLLLYSLMMLHHSHEAAPMSFIQTAYTDELHVWTVHSVDFNQSHIIIVCLQLEESWTNVLLLLAYISVYRSTEFTCRSKKHLGHDALGNILSIVTVHQRQTNSLKHVYESSLMNEEWLSAWVWQHNALSGNLSIKCLVSAYKPSLHWSRRNNVASQCCNGPISSLSAAPYSTMKKGKRKEWEIQG